jgi:hypothetical protein
MLARKAYRSWVPRQSYLLPPSPLEWLPEDDLAYFVLDLAGELDWSAITDRYQEKDARGTVPYHPVMMGCCFSTPTAEASLRRARSSRRRTWMSDSACSPAGSIPTTPASASSDGYIWTP